MFADYLPSSTDSSIRNPRPNCQRSITPPGTRQYTTLVNSDQNRLVSSQEKNTSPMQEAVRFRGIHKIRDRSNSSTKISRIFRAINHESTRMIVRQRRSGTVDFEICVYSCSFRSYDFLITYLRLREGGRFP